MVLRFLPRITEWRAENVDLLDVQCTARRFAIENDGDCYVYYVDEPGSRERALKVIEFTKRVSEFYRSNYCKTAASGQLHVMQMPEFGNISSDNVVGISDEMWDRFEDEVDPRITLAHELVHPFVQIPVEMSDPLYSLAVEGFPSYLHLPALDEILGGGFYVDFMKEREAQYLHQSATGKDRRGRSSPPEKPIYEIAPDDIGTYKDRFVLADRVPLFLEWLRLRMGDGPFFEFTSDLFNRNRLDLEVFEKTVLKYLPDARDDLRLWLETTEFPERFRSPR